MGGLLDQARKIAARAHDGQADKAGRPYIEHCERVASRVSGEDAQVVAYLHDVVEKGPGWTLDRLRTEGFSPRTVDAVDALTRRAGEEDADFVRRAAADTLARAVKRADLEDNLMQVEGRDPATAAEYRQNLQLLTQSPPFQQKEKHMIGAPQTRSQDPEREAECRHALRLPLDELIDGAVAAGWQREEVVTALEDLLRDDRRADLEGIPIAPPGNGSEAVAHALASPPRSGDYPGRAQDCLAALRPLVADIATNAPASAVTGAGGDPGSVIDAIVRRAVEAGWREEEARKAAATLAREYEGARGVAFD